MSVPASCLDGPYLYHTRHGYVLRCACCDRYEVAFRHTCARVAAPHFARLLREVQALSEQPWEVGSFGVLRLTPDDAPAEVRVLLDRPDLLELHELLGGGAAMDELDGLLRGDVHGRAGKASKAPDAGSAAA